MEKGFCEKALLKIWSQVCCTFFSYIRNSDFRHIHRCLYHHSSAIKSSLNNKMCSLWLVGCCIKWRWCSMGRFLSHQKPSGKHFAASARFEHSSQHILWRRLDNQRLNGLHEIIKFGSLFWQLSGCCRNSRPKCQSLFSIHRLLLHYTNSWAKWDWYYNG